MLINIGRRIKCIRQVKGMTQEALAEKANLSLTCISRLENEKSMVSLEKLLNISQVLETDLSIILCDYIHKDSSPEEVDMLSKFKLLTNENKKTVLTFINFLYNDL